MKRKHKNYSKPRIMYDKDRITEEEKMRKELGLKNKREIWKADAKVREMREKAKRLISSGHEQQETLFNQIKKMGINVNSISDVLSLDKKDYLKRRLQTVLVEKHIANTVKAARQLITHRKVLVDGRVVNVPSYIVPIDLENKINLKTGKTKTKKKEIVAEKSEEIEADEESEELNSEEENE